MLVRASSGSGGGGGGSKTCVAAHYTYGSMFWNQTKITNDDTNPLATFDNGNSGYITLLKDADVYWKDDASTAGTQNYIEGHAGDAISYGWNTGTISGSYNLTVMIIER